MALVFRTHNQSVKEPPNHRTPGKVFTTFKKVYALADDTIHRVVNITAEGIMDSRLGRRFNITRARIAAAGLYTGILAEPFHHSLSDISAHTILSDMPAHTPIFALALVINHLSFKRSIKMEADIIENHQSAEQTAEHFSIYYNKIIRFPVLLIGSVFVILDYFTANKSNFHLPGEFFIGHSVMLYLLSSSNNTIDKIKAAIKNFLRRTGEKTSEALAPSLEPVPVEVRHADSLAC